MRVMITDNNKDFFESWGKIEPLTVNTSTLIISKKKFTRLYKYLEEKGKNPFALMVW